MPVDGERAQESCLTGQGHSGKDQLRSHQARTGSRSQDGPQDQQVPCTRRHQVQLIHPKMCIGKNMIHTSTTPPSTTCSSSSLLGRFTTRTR